ncbi:MAG: VWA domain-containing protein [Lewinellaceae bacterium]|nr:VWA domain-containing protein [Lewinellaceae bacterium]
MKKLLLLLLLTLSTSLSAIAQQENTDRSLSPYFLVNAGNGKQVDALPLKATGAQVNIAGVIADVVVTQKYVNTGTTPLEAIYVFPASTRAAVYGLRMEVGSRCIIAKIKEKKQARQDYEQAKSEGKRASLLEQERPNVFQMNVANIMPGDTIKVSLQYTELLVPESGVYSFVYPTVVGPRYTNGQSADNNGFTTNPTHHAGEKPDYRFGINVHLAAGMPLQNVLSSTHKIQVNRPDPAIADIRLAPSETSGGNRDFILQYQLQGEQIQTGLLLYNDGQEQFFLCMAQPPKSIKKADFPPREYIFVVDVSGSMNGFPLNISKQLLQDLIRNLQPSDRFNVILFAGTSNILAEKSLAATAANAEKAVAFIDKQEGSGGTELLPALQRALQLPRQAEGLSRSIVVVTDGYIDLETASYDLIRKNLNQANLYAFGIGSSVNRFLIEGMAHVGQGLPFVVTTTEEAPAIASKFRRYIANPVFTQITTKFRQFDAYDVEPLSIPDVLAERPVIIFGKYRGEATGSIDLRGYGGKGKRKQTLSFDVSAISPDPRNSAIRYLWARERVRNLSDYMNLDYQNRQDSKAIADITSLGLRYNLLTAYTSFIAVEEDIKNKSGNLKTVKQALPLPVGVSDLAVGFDLSIEGISGLDLGGNNSPLASILLAILFAAGLMLLVGRRKFRWFSSLTIGLALAATSCSKPLEYSNADEITIMLGDDHGYRNPYFAKAKSYFQTDSLEKTQLIISNAKSLQDVRQYLRQHPPQTGAWKRINLVVHGNEWTGMNVPVINNGPRTATASLRQYIKEGEFSALPNSVTNEQTEVIVYGCNLGRDIDLLRTLSMAFGNKRRGIPHGPLGAVFQHLRVGRTSSRQCTALPGRLSICYPSRRAVPRKQGSGHHAESQIPTGHLRFFQGTQPLTAAFPGR